MGGKGRILPALHFWQTLRLADMEALAEVRLRQGPRVCTADADPHLLGTGRPGSTAWLSQIAL